MQAKNLVHQNPSLFYLFISLIGVGFLFGCKTPPGTSPAKKLHSPCTVSGQAATLNFNFPANTWNLTNANPSSATITNNGPGPALLGSTSNLFPTDVVTSFDITNTCTAGLCLANGASCTLAIDLTTNCYSGTPSDPGGCNNGPYGLTGQLSFSYTDGTGTKTVLGSDQGTPVAFSCYCEY